MRRFALTSLHMSSSVAAAVALAMQSRAHHSMQSSRPLTCTIAYPSKYICYYDTLVILLRIKAHCFVAHGLQRRRRRSPLHEQPLLLKCTRCSVLLLQVACILSAMKTSTMKLRSPLCPHFFTPHGFQRRRRRGPLHEEPPLLKCSLLLLHTPL